MCVSVCTVLCKGVCVGVCVCLYGSLQRCMRARVCVVVVVVVDHISLGGPFMFSMNRPIIFCCLILLCNGL